MSTADGSALVALSEELAAAIERRDVERVASHLADDFVHRTPGGDARDRGAFLAALKDIPGDIELVRVHDLQTDVSVDSAVVCGIQHARVRVGHEVFEERRAFVDYFVRINGVWRLRTAIDLPVAPVPDS